MPDGKNNPGGIFLLSLPDKEVAFILSTQVCNYFNIILKLFLEFSMDFAIMTVITGEVSAPVIWTI